MSTVPEIKQAVNKLPPRRPLALAQRLQGQVDDRLSDDQARALDQWEAAEDAGVLRRTMPFPP